MGRLDEANTYPTGWNQSTGNFTISNIPYPTVMCIHVCFVSRMKRALRRGFLDGMDFSWIQVNFLSFFFFFWGCEGHSQFPLKKKIQALRRWWTFFQADFYFLPIFGGGFQEGEEKKQLMNNKIQEESTPTFGSARLVRNPWATCPSVLECGESWQWSENPDHWLPGFGGLINLLCSLWFEWYKHRFPRKPQGTHNQQIDRFFEKDNWTIVEQLRKNDGAAVAPTKRFRKFRSCSTLLPPCRVEPEMEAEKSRCQRESSRKKP